jgi:hypothetical protein
MTYRNELDAARLRVETLEAQLAERDAELAEQQAALALRDAELAELKAGRKGSAPARRYRVWLNAAVILVALGLLLWSQMERREAQRAELRQLAREEQRGHEQQEADQKLEELEENLREAQDKQRAIDSRLATVGDPDPTELGRLKVNCVSPAEVWIDGKPVGSSPVDVEVAAGRHAVRCDDGAGGQASKSVSVTSGDTSTLLIEL